MAIWARETPCLSASLPTDADDGAVGVFRLLVERLAEFIRFAAHGLLIPGARQPATGERAPGDHRDLLILAEGQHFALLLAIEQVQMILHADEGRPAVGARGVEHLGELPGVHGGSADIARLACLHDVMQRFRAFPRSASYSRNGGSDRGQHSRCRGDASCCRSRRRSPCARGRHRSDRDACG